MTDRVERDMDCERIDELAGAAALGAVDPAEARAAARHLETCEQPHAELRSLLGADGVLAATLEPVAPDAALRARVMASVADAPQDQRPALPTRSAAARPIRRSWRDWSSVSLWRGLAAAAAVVILVVGVWNIGLQRELATREAALSAIADAIAGGYPAHAVSGPAGSGYVIDTAGPGATFVVAGLASLPAGDLYEMWLIDAAGTPLAVGIIEQADLELAVAALERDLEGFAAFAVTVEAERVDAPTGEPVMVGTITN